MQEDVDQLDRAQTKGAPVLRVLGVVARGHDVEDRLGPRGGHARLHASHDEEVALALLVRGQVRPHAEGHPEVGADRRGDPPLEGRRCDSDHRVGPSVQADVPAHQVRIGAVAALPEAVGQDHHRVRARRGVLLGEERATPLGGHPQDVEVVARDHLAQDHLGLAVVALDGARVGRGGRHRGEGVARAVTHQLVRVPVRIEVAVPLDQAVYVHQRGRVAHAPLLEQHRVDHGEDGRVRADPERQGEDRHRREGRRLAHHAQGEPQVREKCAHDPVSQ